MGKDSTESMDHADSIFETIEQEVDSDYGCQMDIDCENLPITIDEMPIPVDGSDITGAPYYTNYRSGIFGSPSHEYCYSYAFLDMSTNNAVREEIIETNMCEETEESSTSPHHQWNFDEAQRLEEDGSHLMIDNSMTNCDDGSGDNIAVGAVEILEPSIQNLELEQKFNDAESYLIESGEIGGDGSGKVFFFANFFV